MPSVTMFQLPQEPSFPSTTPAATQTRHPGNLAERIAPLHVLRHTGHRPALFNGQLLGTACGVNQVLPYWYEINVFRTVLGAYVSDIRLFNKTVDAADLFRVAEHDDVEALHAYLENYDPCGDLPPSRYDEDGTSVAALMLRATEMRAEMRRITDHYRTTVSALLAALPG